VPIGEEHLVERRVAHAASTKSVGMIGGIVIALS